MKIAYISNSRFPSERAHAVQIVHMCNAFAEQGNQVTFLVTNRPTHIKNTPEEFYGVPLRFAIVTIDTPDIAGNIHKLPSVLRPLAYTIQRLFFTVNVWKYLRNQKFDCVYGRDEWILTLLSYITKIPTIWESHEAKYSLIAQRLLQCSKKIIVISEGIRDFYVQKGISKEKMLVAHDAVDDGFFGQTLSKKDARDVLGIASEKPVVMYIGGLDPWKGVNTLFEASENNYEEISTYVIGGKDNEIENYQSEYPHVHFLGPRPYKELRDYQQAADILVIPNTAKNKLSALYTSPLKLFAHMTSKVPIVASDIPSIRNVLSDTEAYFFEADNAKSLVTILTRVIKDKSESLEKAQKAYALSLNYTWAARARSITEFIKK